MGKWCVAMLQRYMFVFVDGDDDFDDCDGGYDRLTAIPLSSLGGASL